MTLLQGPLRIAVLGGGKIGSAFAFQLARTGGHEVTVIARPNSARLAQLERDRAVVDVKGERAAVSVASALDEDKAFDLLIVTLLDHQLEPILPALQRCAAQNIQFMVNTFRSERLQSAVGSHKSAFGMPFIQATLDKSGRLRAVIGAGGQRTLISDQRWVDVFNSAGLPAALEVDMIRWLKCHVPLCIAFESVSVAAVRRGGGASWRDALKTSRGVNAAFSLIRALGFEIYPTSKARLAASPVWVAAMMFWTISRFKPFRELLATGEAECRALIEAMLAAAPPGTPAPVLAAIAAMAPEMRDC